MLRIGIDLGGTKIEGIALGASGDERARRRIATPQGDYDATIRAVIELVQWLESEAHDEGTVGIGIPGAISRRTGQVKNANSVWLNGRTFDVDLAKALGRPVRLENDANCLAVSEAVDGAAAGARLAFAVILGTGVGGGIALEGRARTGLNAIAGEWGHNPLPWPRDDELPGPACYCGKRGCLETWLSGPGFAADHLRCTGETLSSEWLAKRAEQGDAGAEASVRRYIDRLGRGLATVVNLMDPDVVVLGGGVSKLARLYSALPERLQAWTFSDGVETPIRPALHGDASGVRGAAWLWPR